MNAPQNIFLRNTSIYIGVFFCVALSSCKENKQTPDWKQDKKDVEIELKSYIEAEQEALDQPIRFISYNLKNYLTYSKTNTSGKTSWSKKESEIDALVDIISDAQPDILGICEIGTKKDLTDFQKRLKKRNINLPHSQLTRGADPVRSLAILSRFPISKTNTPKESHYIIKGIRLQISRGILDTTIQLPNQEIRLLGVHLKSKRPSTIADQALMRRNESLLVRKHINTILKETPDTELLVYGDMNDSRRSNTLDSIRGRSNSPYSLKIIELKDSRGDSWTHYWAQEDIYSRFDYIAVNSRLKKRVVLSESKVLDPKIWNSASDHRPLLLTLK